MSWRQSRRRSARRHREAHRHHPLSTAATTGPRAPPPIASCAARSFVQRMNTSPENGVSAPTWWVMCAHPHATDPPPSTGPLDSEGEACLEGGAHTGLADAPNAPASTTKDASGIERLFEMTSDLLAAISLDGRFTLLNPAWEDMLGWSIEELVAQPMQARVHP